MAANQRTRPTAHEEMMQGTSLLALAIQEQILPGETYLSNTNENCVPGNPYNSLRVGTTIVIDGDMKSRPTFIYEDQESHKGANLVIFPDQKEDEVFYGYYRKDRLETLPRIPHIRVTENVIKRAGVELVRVYVGQMRVPKAPKPPKKERVPSTPKERQQRVPVYKPLPSAPVVPKPAIIAIKQPPPVTASPAPLAKQQPTLLHTQGQTKVPWKKDDRVNVELIGGAVGFCRNYNVSDGEAILAGTYPGIIRSHDNILWVEVSRGSELFYKTLGDINMFPDRVRLTVRTAAQ